MVDLITDGNKNTEIKAEMELSSGAKGLNYFVVADIVIIVAMWL